MAYRILKITSSDGAMFAGVPGAGVEEGEGEDGEDGAEVGQELTRALVEVSARGEGVRGRGWRGRG